MCVCGSCYRQFMTATNGSRFNYSQRTKTDTRSARSVAIVMAAVLALMSISKLATTKTKI